MNDRDGNRVRVFRLEVMVVDHDEIGEAGIREVFASTKFPNRCIRPHVVSAESREVVWETEDAQLGQIKTHPLNISDPRVWIPAFRELFDRRG